MHTIINLTSRVNIAKGKAEYFVLATPTPTRSNAPSPKTSCCNPSIHPRRALGTSTLLWTGTIAIWSMLLVSTAHSLCPTELGKRLEAIATRPEFSRARWGILVQTLEQTESRSELPLTLYARDAHNYFTPASNIKLLTTAAALTQLGPRFQIQTSVYAENNTFDAVSLRVVGRGDPTLSDQHLHKLAQQIADHGITQVTELIADPHYFRGDPINPNWEWEDVQAGYGAPATSLILNHNEVRMTLTPTDIGQPLEIEWQNPSEAIHWQVENRSTTVTATEPEFIRLGRDMRDPQIIIQGQLRVGARSSQAAVSIPDPTHYFLQRFRHSLESEQISVHHLRLATEAQQPDGQPLAQIQSPPLSELLVATNQDSRNLYAESLLRQLGAIAPTPGSDSTLTDGIAAIVDILTELGIDSTSYVLADGSGLSRHNLASPDVFVQVLQVMGRSPDAQIYRDSLAVAGISGTLRNRFRDTPVEGHLWGKTGGLTGVSSLSGYLHPANYRPVVFSILIDHSEQLGSVRRTAIDEMVLEIAQLQDCS